MLVYVCLYSFTCIFMVIKFMTLITQCLLFNWLGPNDAIWQQGSGSTWTQVMACCLTAPSHYLNQCWLIIRKVQWYSSEDNFTSDISAINHWNKLENYLYKIHWNLPGGQWVKAPYGIKNVYTSAHITIVPHSPTTQSKIPLEFILIAFMNVMIGAYWCHILTVSK